MQYTAGGVSKIVVAAPAVIDGIPAAAVSVAFEQPQFSKQPRVIGQAHQAAREQWQAFQINGRLGQLRFRVIDTALPPRRLAPLGAEVVPYDRGHTIRLAQLGKLLGSELWIKRRGSRRRILAT